MSEPVEIPASLPVVPIPPTEALTQLAQTLAPFVRVYEEVCTLIAGVQAYEQQVRQQTTAL